jgi:AraC-like DNA-binding protein
MTNFDLNSDVRTDSAQYIVDQLDKMGFDTSGILEGTEIRRNWREDKDITITYADYIKLVENVLDLTKDSGFGLKVGRTISHAYFGVFGYALMSCKTLGECADLYIQYQDIPGQLTEVSSQRIDSEIIIHINPLFQYDSPVLAYAIDESMSIMHYGWLALSGKVVPWQAIELTFPPPKHAGLYEEIFQCPIKFMASANIMKYDAQYSEVPTVTANAIIYKHCIEYCEQMSRKLSKSDKFIDSIRRVILSSPGRFPVKTEVSKKLAMSSRSLNRKLKDRKTSYRQIMEDIRTELAKEYLSNTDFTIDTISELLGFSETPAFRRAFKQWTNSNASQYRKEMKNSKLKIT